MIAIVIGQQEDQTVKMREMTSVIAKGGQIYRDNLGQQYAVFTKAPDVVASTAKRILLNEIPNTWKKL